jgi:lysophospholipase L1-like esterase
VSLAISSAVILFLAGLEIVLRVTFHRSLDFSIEMWKYETRLKLPVADPAIGFVHRPSAHAFLMGVDVDINSAGQRDREYPTEKPPGTYRIMLLGDSTTLGWGVRLEDTIPKLLERALNSAQGQVPSRFEVINAGVGNYGTRQEVSAYLASGRAFHPDLVILSYFINDAEEVPRADSGLIARHLYAAAFLASRLDAALRTLGGRPTWREYYASLYQDDRAGWRDAKDAIHTLARTARADRSALLITILPELHQINGDYPFSDAHSKVKAVAAEDGVAVIDLLDTLRGHGAESTLWVTPRDLHPNRKANLLVAEKLRREVLALTGR